MGRRLGSGWLRHFIGSVTFGLKGSKRRHRGQETNRLLTRAAEFSASLVLTHDSQKTPLDLELRGLDKYGSHR
jgi:hypothetical protein